MARYGLTNLQMKVLDTLDRLGPLNATAIADTLDVPVRREALRACLLAYAKYGWLTVDKQVCSTKRRDRDVAYLRPVYSLTPRGKILLAASQEALRT